VTNNVGTATTSAAGVTFSARTVGTGALRATVAADTASANITVFNGALASVSILDQNSQPISGTLVVSEGSRVQFDALGHDAYGNSIVVNPTWTGDSHIGNTSAG